MINDLLYRLRALFRRDSVERELDDELRFHFDRHVAKGIEAGLTPEEAVRRARIEFGGLDQVKEECREARGVHWLETALQDIRYGLRMLRKSPGFTMVAILTLALGIGANTAIFSVVNPVLFRPLPFKDPARLVTVLETNASEHLEWLWTTQISFVEWQRRAPVFESIAAYRECGFQLVAEGEPHFLQGECVSTSFLPMLGVQPILGRLWSPDEELSGHDHVAVLSYGAWKQQFGGDPQVLHRTLWRSDDRELFEVIGVLPPDFQFVSDLIAVWAPSGIVLAAPTRFHDQMVFARLKPNVSIQQAQASMDSIALQVEKDFPKSNTGWGVTVQPIQRFYSGLNNARPTLLVLLTAVGALLLIACANVANLLLARATMRQQEIAVRVAFGASRSRLVRQLLTESLLLGMLGGTAGFLVAWAAFGSLISFLPPIPSFEPHSIRIDSQVFLFSLLMSLLAGVVFGLAPALRSSKKDLNELQRQASRAASHGTLRDRIVRNLLIVGEMGMAVVLLTGTTLLVQSLRNLQRDNLGFDTSHVLTMEVCCLEQASYPDQASISSFYRQLFERVRAVPGVEAASGTTELPLRQFQGAGTPFLIQGRTPPPPGKPALAGFRQIEPDYFSTMKIPLLRGRTFTLQDDEQHPLVALINQAMVQQFFASEDPIGQQVQIVNLQPFGQWFKVIGVVANSKDAGLGTEIHPMIFLDDLQIRPFG
ncbi:MAG TPA: ABC transporter permease, partial [Candidatus Angelobacter sp.]